MKGTLFLLQGNLVWPAVLVLLYSDHVFSDSYWTSIDCGAKTSYIDRSGMTWQTDSNYIRTGENKPVTREGLTVSEQLGTLRFFTSQNKNCYLIPSPDKVKYIIRAQFFYGNYDGLAKPPTFDLVFDGNKWATVVTSMDEPVTQEMIYAAEGDYISICVARTQADQNPFISSLESIPLAEKMYDKMNRNYAWFLSYRVNFAGDDAIGYPYDTYGRVWEPHSSGGSGGTIVPANFTEFSRGCANDIPFSVISPAMEEGTILIGFTFPEATNTSYYLSLYFTEVIQPSPEDKRAFTIIINGQDYGLENPQYQICDEFIVTTNPLAGSMSLNLTSTDDSTLPALISAAEVFIVSPTLGGGTNQADAQGLQALLASFSQLRDWSGDPCLPSNTVWEWLDCNGDDPPRVTALYLTGYGLEGSIPNFDTLRALETIYMDDNQLTGEIPEFLGNLPKLKQLNLANNNLDGEVPSSVTSNGHLKFNSTGNPLMRQNEVEQPEEKERNNLDALWSLIVLGLFGYGIWYCWCRGGRKSETVVYATGVPVANPSPPPPLIRTVTQVQTTVTMAH